jgi:hypothetical protein
MSSYAVPTNAVAGRRGDLRFHSGGSGNAIDLHLTKWGLHLKGDSIDVTNVRSPLFYAGPEPILFSEFITGVTDAELTFEGVYTIVDTNATNPQTSLLFLGSGSGTGTGLVPGTSDVTTPTGLITFSLYPDTYDNNSKVISGNAIIETFEIDGEVRGAVMFKGTAKITGGYTYTATL